MISDFVYDLCQNKETVSSRLAREPKEAPGEVAQELFGKKSALPSSSTSEGADYNVQRAFECGNWGPTRPSETFLRIYEDVLNTISKNHPLAGVCSPPLLGSSGVCPLVVISTVPEICKHMSNLIVKARHEVFLATNFWKYSEGSRLITNALKELSRRALSDSRRVVVKIMYDRGDPKQLIKNHQNVPPKTFSDPEGAVRIPHPDDLPNIDLEVVNYHKPPLGTFHSKFMIVDREIALLQSNNIQDNDNMEMALQLEGAVVDSVYDMALITWNLPLQPMLPLITQPASQKPTPTFEGEAHGQMYNQDGQLNERYTFRSAGQPNSGNADAMPDGSTTTRDVAAMAAENPMPPHTSQDPHYDDNIAQEVLRASSAFVPRHGESRIKGVSKLLNIPTGSTEASCPEISAAESMVPIIPINKHDPFPCVMVNREPYGPPTNASLHVPQNAAFNGALRHAQSSVFIQTPNLNAAGLLPEILAACRRGIQVTYFYCLGYNDTGELLPGQGGHNEFIAHKLYSELEPKYHENLNIHAYVAKDQIRPIHNKFKQRSCHIKLLIADERICIQGSGNQDTQTWYHSQEVNVMFESEMVCTKILEGIRQNQNTFVYGKVRKDGPDSGCWLDPETGKQADAAIGVDAGKFAWAKGFKGAIDRVRGVGGF